jgi:hypothetical protein
VDDYHHARPDDEVFVPGNKYPNMLRAKLMYRARITVRCRLEFTESALRASWGVKTTNRTDRVKDYYSNLGKSGQSDVVRIVLLR